MDTEDYAFPYIKPENEIPLDQPEFYVEDSKEHLTVLLQNEKICQFCKQICTNGFTFVKDLESDITCNINVSQMNFSFTNEPIVCSSCHHSLNADKHFLKNSCKIANTFEEMESPSYIKIEDMEMKIEADEVGNTPIERQFERDQLKHENGLDPHMYKCDSCDYESKNKNYLKRHKLVHKNSSDVQMYTCEICQFRTKHKRSLAEHQLRHNDKSTVPMYKCPSCAYETNRKQNFHRHQIKHKTVGEVQMYKCHACEFQTKHEKYLATHQLTHQDKSQGQTYACGSCDYQTNRKKNLRRHQMKHKTVANVRMYKCDLCRYQSKTRNHLARHKLLVHRDGGDVPMYKCGICEFQTKHEQYLATHRLRHSVAAEVQMYRCSSCAYETVQKRYLQRHQAKHKSDTGGQVYTCDTCGYGSRYRHLIELHRLGSEMRMYRCSECSFEARNRKCVGHHELAHKDDPGVRKCDEASDEFQPFEFKAVSMDTEDSVFPYVKSENREDSKEHLKTLLDNERICQLCKQTCTHGFTLVKDLESDLTGNLSISKVNFNSTTEPVVCPSCLDPLNTRARILNNSSNLQYETTTTSKEKNGVFHIKTEKTEMKYEEDGNTPECNDKGCGGQTCQNHNVTHETLSITINQHEKTTLYL